MPFEPCFQLSQDGGYPMNSNLKGHLSLHHESTELQQHQEGLTCQFDYNTLTRHASATTPSFSIPHSNLPLPLSSQALLAPSSLGLPVYSASGLDLLSILARVATRPHPKVVLGPVDMTCSFVVVDVRRYDNPIIYCSPTFCHLTGYEEHEVLGRNCRFLQAPSGVVAKGEPRRFVTPEPVAYLRNALAVDEECQASIVNYRKGGEAFFNLVTVIPIAGGVSGSSHEASDIAYHVGFQVDFTEQNAAQQKLTDGSTSGLQRK